MGGILTLALLTGAVPPTGSVHPAKRPAASVTPPVVASGGRVFASSLVHAGDAWALAYYRARNSVDSDLYLVRFDDDARVLSDTHLGPGIPASLAWSGDSLGVAYSVFEGGDYAAYFARVDARGQLIEGSRVRLTEAPCYAPRLTWNGKKQEWGVAWHGHRDAQPKVRLTRIAGSGVVLGTEDVATMAGMGGAAALVSVRGRYHFLLAPPLRWLEHDGERVIASAELAAQAFEPSLVEADGVLLASWVEGSQAVLARLEDGQVPARKVLYDAGGTRHLQGLVLAPYASSLMLFWGEHTSAVYDTAVFSARLDSRTAATPTPLDPTPEPQGFPFVAAAPRRLMLVYQLGDYNGAPRLVARSIDVAPERADDGAAAAFLARLMAEPKPSIGESLRAPAPMGPLPSGALLPCGSGSVCPEADRRAPRVVGPPDKMIVTGTLSERTVAKVIAAAGSPLRSCLSAQPRGKLVLGFTIDARGQVMNVSLRQTTFQDPQVTDCLTAVLARLRFGPSTGSTSVKLPIEVQR